MSAFPRAYLRRPRRLCVSEAGANRHAFRRFSCCVIFSIVNQQKDGVDLILDYFELFFAWLIMIIWF